MSNFPVIRINNHYYPAPDQYFDLVVSTTVDGGFNIANQFVGQKVGKDRCKIDNLTWKYLDASTWADILQEFEDFYATVRLPDMVHNTWQNIIMYPGDRTATVAEYNASGLPTYYKDCKINIIDTGWDA